MGDEIFAEFCPVRAACRTRIRHCPHVARDARCVCVFVNVRLFVVRVFVCYTTREKKRARDVRVRVCACVLNEYCEHDKRDNDIRARVQRVVDVRVSLRACDFCACVLHRLRLHRFAYHRVSCVRVRVHACAIECACRCHRVYHCVCDFENTRTSCARCCRCVVTRSSRRLLTRAIRRVRHRSILT